MKFLVYAIVLAFTLFSAVEADAKRRGGSSNKSIANSGDSFSGGAKKRHFIAVPTSTSQSQKQAETSAKQHWHFTKVTDYFACRCILSQQFLPAHHWNQFQDQNTQKPRSCNLSLDHNHGTGLQM